MKTNSISQGIAASHLRYGGIISVDFITTWLLSMTVTHQKIGQRLMEL